MPRGGTRVHFRDEHREGYSWCGNTYPYGLTFGERGGPSVDCPNCLSIKNWWTICMRVGVPEELILPGRPTLYHKTVKTKNSA